MLRTVSSKKQPSVVVNNAVRALSSFASPIKLNNLQDNPGAIQNSKRVGRGVGSGKGKTSGRGHKGQKARAGGSSGRGQGFEGGQTPLYMRLPKRGFNNTLATPMESLNLSKLQLFIDMGRINPEAGVITLKTLQDCNIVGNIKHDVKLLGKDAQFLTSKINIQVSRASASAIKAVEAAGGQIETVHFNRLGLRAHLKPEKFEEGKLPRQARPPPKLMEYYTNYEKRGYLSAEKQLCNETE